MVLLNENIWAGAIIFFAVAASAVTAIGIRKHRSVWPFIVSLAGAGLLVYTMYVNYSVVTELIGFVVLGVAAWMDYNARRWARVTRSERGKRFERDDDLLEQQSG